MRFDGETHPQCASHETQQILLGEGDSDSLSGHLSPVFLVTDETLWRPAQPLHRWYSRPISCIFHLSHSRAFFSNGHQPGAKQKLR